MSHLAGLIALLIGALALGPAALSAATECWPAGIFDAEPDELVPGVEHGDVVVHCGPVTVARSEPVAVATVRPVAAGLPGAPALSPPGPRAPPA